MPQYTIALTPAAKPVWPVLQTCAGTQPGALFIIRESFYMHIESDLAVWLGAPEELPAFSVPLGYEEIVLVVNPGNPLGELNARQVQALFTGRVQDWTDLGWEGQAQPWALLDADEARALFELHTLGGTPITPNTRLAPDSMAMLEAVSEDRHAIGYLPGAWVDGGVQAYDLGIEVPVLALADEEPEGILRSFIACLQGEIGQAALAAAGYGGLGGP